jgi:hypothetical protein
VTAPSDSARRLIVLRALATALAGRDHDGWAQVVAAAVTAGQGADPPLDPAEVTAAIGRLLAAPAIRATLLRHLRSAVPAAAELAAADVEAYLAEQLGR